jgi:DnaJ-class molecular chaperone
VKEIRRSLRNSSIVERRSRTGKGTFTNMPRYIIDLTEGLHSEREIEQGRRFEEVRSVTWHSDAESREKAIEDARREWRRNYGEVSVELDAKLCPECDGYGWVRLRPFPPRERDLAAPETRKVRCPKCHGTGERR